MSRRRRARTQRARARACANIALAKYWGKVDVELNLPAVPSISLTLDRLVTDTEVRLDPRLEADVVELDGAVVTDGARARVVRVLDRVRAEASGPSHAWVRSKNAFPTAAGLASSASGFAALVAAARAAYGLPERPRATSRIARWASASAARSVYGGFVELPAGRAGDDKLAARALHPEDHWDVRIVVALAARGPKAVGSTEGMERSRQSSPLYAAWVESAPKLSKTIRAGIRRKDLAMVGPAMEQSTMAFHSAALTASPPIVYWQPTTLAALATVRDLRARGILAFATMDAGPHVKVLCGASDARRVSAALARTDGVLGTMICRPGPGVQLR